MSTLSCVIRTHTNGPITLSSWAWFLIERFEALPSLARWHIIYQIHVKYVHTTYALLNSAVIVER